MACEYVCLCECVLPSVFESDKKELHNDESNMIKLGGSTALVVATVPHSFYALLNGSLASETLSLSLSLPLSIAHSFVPYLIPLNAVLGSRTGLYRGFGLRTTTL